MTTNEMPDNKGVNPEESPDDSLNNLSRADYNDRMDTHQTLLQAKNAELTRLTEMLRSIRESKEPLAKIKAALQSEINEANKAINAKSEEVTLIKQKLRYHSVRQINENIERLEYQLRNNNFKPREEQKILDEISMLQRSTRTLREYEAKQAENQKYRAERKRLIDERNNNFSKVKALYAQEDEIKKAMTEVRGIISNSRKSLDNLRQIKPTLEKKWVSHHQHQQTVRSKRHEEKKRQRQEQFKPKDRQEVRRKMWEKYEASRDPYEEECDMCRVLITYLQSTMNLSTPSSTKLTPSTPLETPTTPASDQDYSVGAFYMKPRDEDGFMKVSKRERAKFKREQRVSRRVKDLPHTPDVLAQFTKLSITPPKNTDEIPASVIALQDALQHYHHLYVEGKKNSGKEKSAEHKSSGNVKFSRPTTLAVSTPQLLVTNPDALTPAAATLIHSKPGSSFLPHRETLTLASPVVASSSSLHSDPLSSPLDRGLSLAMALPPLSVTSLQVEQVPNPVGGGHCMDRSILSDGSSIASGVNHCVENCVKTPDSSISSPALSWAAIATKQNLPKATPLLYDIPQLHPAKTLEVMCNGAQTPEIVNEPQKFSVSALSEQREEAKICNGILSLGDNDSFFSTPISYTGSLEVNNNAARSIEVNNNATRSYANVTAKVKVAAVDF